MTSSSPYFDANNNTGRQTSRPLQSSSRKSLFKGNTSILNFFKKLDGPPKLSQNQITNYTVKSRNDEEKSSATNAVYGRESLFFTEEGGRGPLGHHISSSEDTVPLFGCFGRQESFDDGDRYNEDYYASHKRQKMDNSSQTGTTASNSGVEGLPENVLTGANPSLRSAGTISGLNRIGPFLDESDSEEDSNCSYNKNASVIDRTEARTRNKEYNVIPRTGSSNESHTKSVVNGATFAAANVCLSSSKTSHSCELREAAIHCEQSIERHDEPRSSETLPLETVALDTSGLLCDDTTISCPICSESLTGISIDDIALHVNNCLDGKPTRIAGENRSLAVGSQLGISISKREKTIPRLGQQNPFATESQWKEPSAFSKIMSGNAEDMAWAAAAAKEAASRRKQVYERTCPFYKILPGFSICVDAFRYGAVEGCNAYFLSHFHSDHYIGLTSSWCHGQIYCSTITGNLVRQQLKVDPKWITDIEFDRTLEIPETSGALVTMLPANHCPGSSMFLFEKRIGNGPKRKVQRILHCGDFRACPAHVQHPLLRPDVVDSLTGKSRQQVIDVCYLDTTYLNPKYSFPNQDDVVTACAAVCADLKSTSQNDSDEVTRRPKTTGMSTMMDVRFSSPHSLTQAGCEPRKSRGRLLVVIGTYSIGKERLCVAIARALNCKIYAAAAKQRICACLEDDELSKLLTNNPLEAQVHMQSLMEVRAETLLDYLDSLKPHFSRVVGFRPTGWNYRPQPGSITANPQVSSVLYSDSWKPRFSTRDLIPQRGSNQESICYSVPYSEHSSFRELTMFCCALRIAKVIPTVNVGSKSSREKMKLWVKKWEAEKRKNGLFKVNKKVTRW
ncbi:hypothetical protein AJ78_08222 [Emergomyces pasteurianus Ep9510]|uniref:DNA repair metallo-beta-lactamase domain-containing protein n=1 Tax=Emergomyces pasteurianus Ep9510 TaxID=1447872 RepID=A0A1J9P3D0_9EURO|nr:hypothetical protein AJ78_08222 [Emergomyces pasteurianus Ep9510]